MTAWKDMSHNTQKRIKGCITLAVILVGVVVLCLYPYQGEYSEQSPKIITRIDSSEVENALVCDGGGEEEPLDSNRLHITGSVTAGEITVYLYDHVFEATLNRTSEDVLYYDDYEDDSLVFKKTYHAGEEIDEWVTFKRKPGTIYCSDGIIVTCPTNMDVDAVFAYGKQGTSYGWQKFLGSQFGDWLRRLLHIKNSSDEQF